MKYGWTRPSLAVIRSMGLSRNARDTKERSEICIYIVDDDDVSDVDNDALVIVVIMIR